MTKLIFILLKLFIIIPVYGITGREIVDRVKQASNTSDSSREATMLIERGNQKLVRKMRMLKKTYGDNDRSLIRFIEPADVRDTQYLSWTYKDPGRDDDLWVFFPTENLIRRISGGGKKSAFMRSDFANEDIELRALDDDIHELVEESKLNGVAVYIVESIPIPEKAKDSNYSKRRVWVDKEKWLELKTEYYDRRDRLFKRLTLGGIQEIGGIWTATKLIMETPRKKSRTLMQYSVVQYDTGLDDSDFEQSSLKR